MFFNHRNVDTDITRTKNRLHDEFIVAVTPLTTRNLM